MLSFTSCNLQSTTICLVKVRKQNWRQFGTLGVQKPTSDPILKAAFAPFADPSSCNPQEFRLVVSKLNRDIESSKDNLVLCPGIMSHIPFRV
jgi:hypothetical protein